MVTSLDFGEVSHEHAPICARPANCDQRGADNSQGAAPPLSGAARCEFDSPVKGLAPSPPAAAPHPEYGSAGSGLDGKPRLLWRAGVHHEAAIGEQFQLAPLPVAHHPDTGCCRSVTLPLGCVTLKASGNAANILENTPRTLVAETVKAIKY